MSLKVAYYNFIRVQEVYTINVQIYFFFLRQYSDMKEMLYAVRCLKSNEDMILALAGQFKQLSHEPEKFR